VRFTLSHLYRVACQYSETDHILERLQYRNKVPTLVKRSSRFITLKRKNQSLIKTDSSVQELESASEVLRTAVVPIVAYDDCKKKFGKDAFILTPDMLCAGYEEGGIDTCQVRACFCSK